MIWYVLAIAALLCGSAFFSAAEMALSSANRLRLENAAEEGSARARCACALTDRYDNTLSAILMGNNLCNIGADSLLTVVTVTLLGTRFTPLSTALMVLFVIFFCESAPKILAKKNANRYTLSFTWVLRVLTLLLWPVTALVSLLLKLCTRPLKGEAQESGDEEAAAELQSIIETVEDEGVIDEERGELLRSALDFSETPVMDVMTARVDMQALDLEDDWEELLRQLGDSPYSRIPVYEDSIDNIVGVLYLNRLFRALLESGGESVDIRPLLLPPCYVYKTVKLSEVLSLLRRGQQHLAVVTDEYGGTLGIVTLEDVMEQIVGEIWDETDEVEQDVVERSTGELELDGDLPGTGLEELLELEEGTVDTDSATVGGWTIESFGVFPQVGDGFEWNGRRFTVLAMGEDGLRVEKVLVTPLEPADAEKE